MSKSVKLNTGIRESILEQLLKHRFEKEELELKEAQEKLALDAYDALISEPVRKRLAELPDGFVPTNTGMRVKFGGTPYYHSLGFPKGVRKRVRHVDNDRCHIVEATDPLYDRHFALEQKEADLNEARAVARKQAKAALYSVATVPKLVSIWPEVAPFVQKYLEAPKPQLPAIPMASLNQLFKLGV